MYSFRKDVVETGTSILNAEQVEDMYLYCTL